MSKICENCKSENDYEAEFCGYCGCKFLENDIIDCLDSSTIRIDRKDTVSEIPDFGEKDNFSSYNSDSAYLLRIEEFCNVLREVWEDGILEDHEAKRVEQSRRELGITEELFQLLDLKIRDELDLINVENGRQPISLGITISKPIIIKEVLEITFSVKNLRKEIIRSVEIEITNEDEIYCMKIVVMPKEIINLKPNETKLTRIKVDAERLNTNGETIELKVITVTNSGVKQVHRCEETIKVPIYKDKGDIDQGVKKLYLSSSSGGVANANLNPEMLRSIRELHIESDGGVSNLQALSAMLSQNNKQTGILFGGEEYQILTLVIDTLATEEFELADISLPSFHNGCISTGTVTDEACLKIFENNLEREIFISSKNITTLGRPCGGADFWIFVYDKNIGKINVRRTESISRNQFCVKYDGSAFLIRDGGNDNINSTNGTLLNNTVLSASEWRAVKQHDKIAVARGILEFSVNLGRLMVGQKYMRENISYNVSTDMQNIDKQICSTLKLLNSRVSASPYEYVFMPVKLDIGAAVNSGLRLKSDNVSELNARLIYDKEKYVLKNLDSLNNVYLNKTLVEFNQSVCLTDKDIINIGDAQMIFSSKCFR